MSRKWLGISGLIFGFIDIIFSIFYFWCILRTVPRLVEVFSKMMIVNVPFSLGVYVLLYLLLSLIIFVLGILAIILIGVISYYLFKSYFKK